MSGLANLFAAAYAEMVAQRVTLGLAPMQPAALSNFQFGPEYLEQEQVAPRIVIVPLSSEYGHAQPNPVRNPLSAPPAKSLYTRIESFEAHVWGDPDPAATDTAYSFDMALELVREFLGAMYTAVMGGRGPAAGLTPTSGRWQVDPRGVGMVNAYGRLYVLDFTLSLQVPRDAYTSLAYSTVKGDGKVTRDFTEQITDPVTGQNPVVIPPTIEVP